MGDQAHKTPKKQTQKKQEEEEEKDANERDQFMISSLDINPAEEEPGIL